MEALAAWASKNNFKNIYGIPRGGLVMAVVLSYRTGLPLVMTSAEIEKDTVVVDDISDTGQTLAQLLVRLPQRPKVATLFYEKNTKEKPDFAIHEKTQWIVFPWETEESSKYDSTLG